MATNQKGNPQAKKLRLDDELNNEDNEFIDIHVDSNKFNNESSGETEDGVEGLEAFLETQDKEEFVSESSNENAADLSKFLNDLIEEELGPKIEECLAKAVKKVWNNEINKEKINNLLKGVDIPGIVSSLRLPR